MIIGYTTGVFDLFHVGHVNLLQRAKSMCDKLIVGVSTDELVYYKHKKPVISFLERVEVVRSCKYADLVVPQYSMDKVEAFERYKFNLMFVGDDWFKSDKWAEIETAMNERGVRLIYLPYTKSTSSTMINNTLEQLRLVD